MSSKRSDLDTLNADRQRKPSTTLEQITQSLQNLESRLDRSRDALDEVGRDREPRNQEWKQPAYEPAPSHRERELPRSAGSQQSVRRTEVESPFQSLARDYDKVRGQEEGIASAGRIASELSGLREELRQQMASNMNREFEVLRGELSRMLASSGNSLVMGSGLASEIDRISSAIHNLSERTDDKSLNALREEVEQVKGALASLAREDTVRSSDRRWDDFDRRWTAFETRVDARDNTRDPEIAALSERLQSISDAVSNLPESLSLRSIEENVRILASAVEHFVRQQEHQAPETFRLIDQRLDEISRAIVATSVSNAPILDPEPFQRIEARISSLARQIDEIVEDRSTAQVIDHIVALTHRVDEIAGQGNLPDQAIEQLSRQVLAIAEKIDQTPVSSEREAILQDINERFDVLSAMIERRQGDAIDQGNTMFRDLERRLDDFADRLGQHSAAPLDTTRFMDVLDARFADFADQLASTPAHTGSHAIRNLEDRLESISARIDASAAKFAGMDSGLIRSLESQVAALSEHLSRPAAPLPELEDIGPRLDELERTISGSRDAIIQAAKQAAEQAVQSIGAQSEAPVVTGLTQDLKALESLTRRSDERNNKTFEAIHDTLIKIVDRLGSIDSEKTAEPAASRSAPAATTRVMDLEDTPPLHGDADDSGLPPVLKPSERTMSSPAAPARMPAEAAAEAAMAAIGSDVGEQRLAAPKTRSLFGGLSRALRRQEVAVKETPATSAMEPALPGDPTLEPSLDEPLDPQLANRPLEPGSGAPDLNAIMRRVREERNQTTNSGHTDAARQDFLAAARRHAQAAAAEAAISNKTTGEAGPMRTPGMGGFLKRYRKPMLMAATGLMVVLAGLKIGQMYLTGEDQVAASSPPLIADQKIDNLASADKPVRSAEQTVLPGTASMIEPEVETSDSAANLPDMDAGPAPAMETDEAAAPEANLADAPSQAKAEPTAPEAPETTSTKPAAAETASPAPEVAETASAVPTTAAAPTAIAEAQTVVPQDAGPVALREAAAAGDAKALFEVGARYADGRGVKADMKQAAIWYEKSAEVGFAPAQYRAGNLYEKAVGVDRDIPKAKSWYQKSAEQGNASAMHNLAVLYAMGADGTTDNESAAKWFKAAADLGVKDSQFNLGILAAKGIGMPRSLEESYKWFALAAKAGDSDAAKKRDEIANSLRPEQLQKARGEVEHWKAKPVNPETNSVEIPESWQEAPATTAAVDMEKAVRNIQTILNKNGYDAGNADGVMGQQTKDAIKQFQQDNKMTATGEIDEKLVRALLDRK